MLHPPRFLDLGKTADICFNGQCDVYAFPRDLHAGPILEHNCHDRAGHAAHCRLVRGRREAYYHPQAHIYANDDDRWRDELLHFQVDNGCAAHDASNAFHEGCKRYAADDVLKNAFLFVEMTRNSFQYIANEFIQWLTLRCVFDREIVDDDEERTFWSFLDIPHDWLDIFVDLAPTWRGNSIHMRSTKETDPKAVEHISQIYLWLLRFRKFAQTRWLTAGVSSRSTFRAGVLGLKSLLEWTAAAPGSSDYYLHHHTRFDPDLQFYFGVAAFPNHPMEAFTKMILKDDRLAKNLDRVERTFRDDSEARAGAEYNVGSSRGAFRPHDR